MFQKQIDLFLDEAKTINWFARSGIPNEKYRMVFSLFEACDSWGNQHMEVWEPQIYALEDLAADKMGDDKIDQAFAAVSAAIGDTVWNKFGAFIDRRGLHEQTAVSFELFDMIKRDMAWACIEKILQAPGFFTMLTEIYKEGYFPCSWMGAYPSGKAVVV